MECSKTCQMRLGGDYHQKASSIYSLTLTLLPHFKMRIKRLMGTDLNATFKSSMQLEFWPHLIMHKYTKELFHNFSTNLMVWSRRLLIYWFKQVPTPTSLSLYPWDTIRTLPFTKSPNPFPTPTTTIENWRKRKKSNNMHLFSTVIGPQISEQWEFLGIIYFFPPFQRPKCNCKAL